MTLIGTAIDNKEHLQLLQSPQFMTPHGLMRLVIFDDAVLINDTERTSGVYILGKPRMGKNWLLINMILQDHKEDRGIFFIDPHGDAVDQIVTHANTAVCPFTIYDFEDETTILSINPLIADPTDPAARNHSFAKTKALFDKLWKNTFEEKPWLQLIIQNTIYTFIENQGYMLTESRCFSGILNSDIFLSPICNIICTLKIIGSKPLLQKTDAIRKRKWRPPKPDVRLCLPIRQ